MSKKAGAQEVSAYAPEMSKQAYKDSLYKLQIELVKLQRHFISEEKANALEKLKNATKIRKT